MEIRPILSTLRHNKTGALLIATQVALTLAIVSNATYVIRDRIAVSQRVSGVDDETRVITQRPLLNLKINFDDLQRRDLDALRALPDVEAATVVNQVPLGRSGWNSGLAPEPKSSAPTVQTGMYFDGGDMIRTLGLRLTEGRDFAIDEIQAIDPDTSRDQPPVAIVTQGFARAMFGDAPRYLGRIFYDGNSADAKPIRIVGVVERLQTPWAQLGADSENAIILPMRLLGPDNYYVVRARHGAAAQVSRAMDEALTRNEPQRVISHASLSVEELRGKRYRGERALAWLLVAVTTLLLLVTASGIVGMASLWVSQRRKQIGVRRALGATRGDILRYFVTENLIITGAGVIAGVAAARLLNVLLMHALSLPRLPWEPILLAAMALLPLGVVAVLGPALRASKLSPALATRSV